MDCGEKCLKYMLFGFNFLFWVLGIAVLAVGIDSRIKSSDNITLPGWGEGSLVSAANLLIASGVLVSLIGFMGCCGAMKENKTMLIIYFLLVLLIFILEITAGVLVYTNQDSMEDSIEEHLYKNLNVTVMTNYGKQNPDTAQKALDVALDLFQAKFNCCGSLGPDDWMKSKWHENITGAGTPIAPKSCCMNDVPGCNTVKVTLYQTGCFEAGKNFLTNSEAGKEFLKEHKWQVGGVCVGIGIIQLLVMIAAILLYRAIGKEENLA